MGDGTQWKHVKEFQLGWTGAGKSAIVFLKLDDDSILDLAPSTIQDLSTLGDLLRSGKNVQYSPESQTFRVAWETTRG